MMERTEVFDLMGTLKLYGMRAAYDDDCGERLADPRGCRVFAFFNPPCLP